MKKLILFLLFCSLVLAADTLTINWDKKTTVEVDTLNFSLAPVMVTCTGECGGSFHAYYTVSDSVTEIEKSEHSCYSIKSGSYSCTFNPSFKIFRWKYDPYILIQAKSEAKFNPDGTVSEQISTQTDKINIIRKPGMLTGTVKKLENRAEVSFTCSGGLCMGVKLSTTASKGSFDCGDMDQNSPKCITSFDILENATELKGIATTYIPANGTFETNVIKLKEGSSNNCSTGNCDACLTKDECNNMEGCIWWISGTPPRCTPIKGNPDMPVIPPLQSNTQTTGFFEGIWDWFLSLFGIKS